MMLDALNALNDTANEALGHGQSLQSELGRPTALCGHLRVIVHRLFSDLHVFWNIASNAHWFGVPAQ